MKLGVDRKRLAQEAIVPGDVAATDHEQESLAKVKAGRQRVDLTRAIDHLDGLALAVLVKQEFREAHIPHAVVGREAQPLAIQLFGLDRVGVEARALDPGFAECRIQFQRTIERLSSLAEHFFRLYAAQATIQRLSL